jgi:hypothetical protein
MTSYRSSNRQQDLASPCFHGAFSTATSAGIVTRGGGACSGAARSHQAGPDEIVGYLRSLPTLWAESGPDARQTLTTAIFARLDVLGFKRLESELTADAIDLGFDAALPPVLEFRSQIGEFGRGERKRAFTSDTTATVTFVPSERGNESTERSA